MNTAIQVDIGGWLSRAWKLYTQDLVNFLILSILYVLILLLAKPTFLVSLALGGPLLCGVYHVSLLKVRGKKPEIGEVAEGFKVFVHALLAYLLLFCFKSIALMFCLFPVVFVRAIYLFSYLLIVDRRQDFWNAMETSRKIVFKRFWEFLLFELILLALEIACIVLSFCTCGLGVVLWVFVLPLTWLARAVAYEEVLGTFHESMDI